MMEAVRTSETSVDNQFTRQYNTEDSSEHHTRRRENLKSHNSHAIIIGVTKSKIYTWYWFENFMDKEQLWDKGLGTSNQVRNVRIELS
jgi:hypothetical protein